MASAFSDFVSRPTVPLLSTGEGCPLGWLWLNACNMSLIAVGYGIMLMLPQSQRRMGKPQAILYMFSASLAGAAVASTLSVLRNDSLYNNTVVVAWLAWFSEQFYDLAAVAGADAAAEAAVAHTGALAFERLSAAAGAAAVADLQRLYRRAGRYRLPDPGTAVVRGALPAVPCNVADAVDRHDRDQQYFRQPGAVRNAEQPQRLPRHADVRPLGHRHVGDGAADPRQFYRRQPQADAASGAQRQPRFSDRCWRAAR